MKIVITQQKYLFSKTYA